MGVELGQAYYNNYSKGEMKYNRQMRWLLFLIVPFLIMLAILVAAPLEINTKNHQHAYTLYRLSHENNFENTLRTSALAAGANFEEVVRKYFIGMGFWNRFWEDATQFLSFDQPSQLQSAYGLANLNDSNSVGNSPFQPVSSMWYSQNAREYGELSMNLQQVYDQYAMKSSFLPGVFTPSTQNRLKAISLTVITPNKSIYFQSPPRRNTEFKELSTPNPTSVYAMIKQQSLNQTLGDNFMLITDGMMIICESQSERQQKMISCAHLNSFGISEDLFGVEPFVELLDTHKQYLVTYGKVGQSLLYLWDEKTGVISASSDQLAVASPEETDSFTNIEQTTLRVEFADKNMQYLRKICVFLPDSKAQIASLAYVFSEQSSNLGLDEQGVNKNTLLTVVILFVALGFIGSALILKKLLHGMDTEVFELQDKCKFIVTGDINVQIPEYKGTKDILILYEKVKIINRLHRYSDSSYFTGHFAEKILKYNEALQFINSLHYEPGNLLENMGECYIYIEQWEKAISFLKKSVASGVKQLQDRINLTIDEAFKLKVLRKPLPYGYKQFEIILIRRTFKLIFAYIKYLQFGQLSSKATDILTTEEQAFKKRIQQLKKQWLSYVELSNKLFFPDFAGFSQSIISTIFEAKLNSNMKNITQAKKLIDQSTKLLHIYTQQYQETTKKLKEKGSKLKYLHQKNKLTPHSRVNPEVLKNLKNMNANRIVMNCETSPDKYNKVVEIFEEGVRVNMCTMSAGYLIAVDFRKMLIQLKIDPSSFQSTQIFKQSVPFKTLHYGEITKQIEAQIMKFPTKTSPGLQRQFLFLIDCAKNRYKISQNRQYYQQRADHIFMKLVKKTDRLSIIKFNVKSRVKIECNLTLKESNETILRKEIEESFTDANPGRATLDGIVEALSKSLNRIKCLQSEKVIVMFFKPLLFYQRPRKEDRKRRETPPASVSMIDSVGDDSNSSMKDFGQNLVQLLQINGLRNCKLILICGQHHISQFRSFFGLQDINRRIWGDRNTCNNVVYLIEDRHKSDIDRILMLKTQDVPDNHVFIL